MKVTLAAPAEVSDLVFVKLAREIAMGVFDLEVILERQGITPKQWQTISKHVRFQRLLRSEVEAWNSALNTPERIKLKSAAMVEEWLPELYARLHDRGESLNAKIEGGKLAAALAGIGKQAAIGGGVEPLVVTINLGSDKNIRIEKNVGPMIDGEAVEGP